MLDIIRDGASRGPKAIIWTEMGRAVTQTSMSTETDGFSVQCFKIVAKLYSSPAYFCGEFKLVKLNHIYTR